MSDDREERAQRLLVLSRQIRKDAAEREEKRRAKRTTRNLKWVHKDCREELAAILGVQAQECADDAAPSS